MSVLDQIVKAYDIRGTVPDQLNADVAHALGVGFALFLRSNSNAERIVIARDMRPSGPAFVEAFSRGVLNQGIDVIDLGLGSTDLMYYASGVLDAPGAMFTASHNPAGYNGIKLCVAGARPVGVDTGLLDVKRVADEVLEGGGPKPAATAGSHSERDVLSDFAEHVLTFVDLADIGTLRVVADTANGMGGLVVPAVMERIPSVELEVMYGELDGTFPTIRQIPCSLPTSAICVHGSRLAASTSVWPLTVTPIGSSSSTNSGRASVARPPLHCSLFRRCAVRRAQRSCTT
jgi:phosphomannomutase